MKLYEEFKLVEKMWQDNLTSRIFFDKALGKKYDICKEADFRKCIEDRQYEGTDLEIAWAKLNRARRLRCTLLDYEYGRYAKEILDMAYRVKKEYEYKYNEIKAKTSNEALTESAIKTKIYKTRCNIKMSTNFAKEFKLYESMFSERKHKLTENTTNNKCFYMVLLRTSESYSIEALANDEATARKAYNDTLAGIKPVIEEEDALMLVEVFNLAAFKKLKPFAGKGFTEDEHIDNLLDNILDSYSNTLEYYEPGGDEDEQAGNNANINEYRVVLADYDTDDFDINVEFGLQDPDENEVVDYEYLLKPGQTSGDLVVYLGRDCGFTSIYVHDERPASSSDIKRLAQDTFPVTGTGDDWEDYGNID